MAALQPKSICKAFNVVSSAIHYTSRTMGVIYTCPALEAYLSRFIHNQCSCLSLNSSLISLVFQSVKEWWLVSPLGGVFSVLVVEAADPAFRLQMYNFI